MPERFKVRVAKEEMAFCAGHFITYEGDKCERLHGHNYRVAVEILGPLDANHYVFDFIALKHICKSIAEKLDHRMLLPTGNRLIRVEEKAHGIAVQYRDRNWLFPHDDCVLLPIENTTAELLARFIALQLIEALKREHNYQPDLVHVEVEETPGQSATVEVTVE